MLPTVAISESSFAQVSAELDRVYPREGLAVPLLWLRPRVPAPGPTATLHLEEIERVVIARTLLVPPEKQMNASVRVGVLAQTDRLVADATRALVRRHPRLRACAYLHSHPFARGSTRPSRGASCDYEGHMVPLLERNLDAGLATSFSFIACRTLNDTGWALQAFALDEHARVVDLGFAEVVPDTHPDVAGAAMPHLSRRPIARLIRGWLRRLRRSRVSYRVDELFDGWLRIIVDATAASTSLIALVPITFPRDGAQLFTWDRDANSVSRFDCETEAVLRSSALLHLARASEEVSHGSESRLLLESSSADRPGA